MVNPPAKDPLAADGIAAALAREAERQARAPEGPGDIGAALAGYSAHAGSAGLSPAQSVVRAYGVREVAVVLSWLAAAMLILDSEGLATWARRMEVGRVQGLVLSVLEREQRGLEAMGLTAPRRLLVDAADAAARALGAGEDPLFAEAWGLVELAPYVDSEPELSPEGIDMPAPLPGEAHPRGPLPAVVLLGDSMFAGNLGAAASSAIGDGLHLKVVEAYQIATGLARPDVFDWSHVVAGLLERERPRFVICSLGANDGQAIRVGDEALTFAEPRWDALYQQRLVAMMRALVSGGAQVLWLGLPPMRDEKLNRHVTHLNALFARAARQVRGVEYLELKMLFAGPDGEYATFVQRGASLTRMRMEDGIHYSPAGARALARWLTDWVRERMQRGR